MPDRAAVLTALAEYANKPATSRDVRAEPGETFGRPPLTTLMQYVQELDSKAELDSVLADVAKLIGAADPFRGAVLALNCGTLVEMGGDPHAVFPHLLAELPRHLKLAVAAREAALSPSELFDTNPDAARALNGLRYFLLCVMTVICRDAAFRRALRTNDAIVDAIVKLRDGHAEADFVAQVLGYTDDLELVVLAPNEQKGFRVQLEAVATCAHLFSLLQAELIAGGHLEGEPADPEVLAVARGESAPTESLSDHARFHFAAWNGLTADGTLAGVDFASWLGVEMSPIDIPTVDGTPVVLVGPMVLGSRAWDSNFFANVHDALRSRVEVVEVLPPTQVSAWLDRIRRVRQ
jgi:hypothetical protein